MDPAWVTLSWRPSIECCRQERGQDSFSQAIVCYAGAMPRPKRADEAGAIYHALNRGNARNTIFHKDGEFEAFERILAEGLERFPVKLFAY